MNAKEVKSVVLEFNIKLSFQFAKITLLTYMQLFCDIFKRYNDDVSKHYFVGYCY